jgi:CDP-diglyceride synthetase
MSPASRRTAGILLIVLPTVIYGGVSILSLLINDPAYMQNPLRQNLFRAGHAHAGVLLLLSLIVLRYLDEASLSDKEKAIVRLSVPLSAIFLPAAFFFSVLTPHAAKPNNLIYLAYVGAVLLAFGLIVLGIGLLRKPRQ